MAGAIGHRYGMGGDATLIGRANEITVARQVLERALRGHGGLILIEGESGIGKSALAAEIERLARLEGFSSMRGTGIEFEKGFPFGLLIRVLGIHERSEDLFLQEVAGLLMGRGEETVEVDVAFKIVERTGDALQQRALMNPTLVIADDVQWSDDLSVTALGRALVRATDLPLVIVCAARRDPRLDRVSELVEGSALSRIKLGALDEDAVEALVLAATEGRPGPNLTAKLEGAGGNPLFITELIKQLQEEAALHVADDIAEIDAGELPASLRMTLLSRLEGAEEPMLEVLRVGAALSSFRADEIAAVLGKPPLKVVGLLEAARAEGILVESGDAVCFRHDLLREALYEDMPEALRATIHGEIARAFLKRNADAGRIATHLSLGAQVGDEEAASSLLEVARELATRSSAEAASLIERAVDIAPPRTDLSRDALLDLALVSALGGEPARGEDLARRILEDETRTEVRSAAAGALVRSMILQGKFNDAGPELDDVLNDGSVSPERRSELMAEVALMASGPPEQHGYSSKLANNVLGASESSPTARCISLCALSYLDMFHGNVDGAIDNARNGLELAESQGLEEALRRAPHYYLAAPLMFVDELDHSKDLYLKGMESAERLGATWSLPVYHLLLGHNLQMAGAWEDATAEFDASLRLADQLGTTLQIIPARSFLVVEALHRDDLPTAESHLAAIEPIAASAPLGTYWTPWVRALVAHAKGEIEVSVTHCLQLHRHLLATDHLFVYQVVGPDLLRVLLAGGDRKSAEEITLILERLVPEHPATTPRAVATWARAMLERDAGMGLAAVDLYQDGPRPVELAWAMEDAASLLGPDRRSQSVTLLEEAVVAYTERGLASDVRRADAALRTLGVHAGTRGRRQRAKAGWEALTESELRIAALVAEGLSNPAIAQRLYISRRTVDAHLSHIYSKLDMSSRVQLAAEVVRREAFD